jgi:uncharacterized protein (TIGR02996 family)
MSEDAAFVQAIVGHPEDQALRLIYADWLDDRADRRAAFLRLEAEWIALPETDPRRPGVHQRMLAARTGIDHRWLAAMERTPIENCLHPSSELICPRFWQRLEQTPTPAFRHCNTCRKDVSFCTTLVQAQIIAGMRRPVVVDLLLERWPGDLERPAARRPIGVRRPTPAVRRSSHRPLPLRKGSEVTITGGTFTGHDGRITRLGIRGGRATVRILVDDRPQFVSIDVDNLEPN